MKALAAVLRWTLAAGCAAPLPPSALTPLSTQPPASLPSPTQSITPSASPTPSAAASPSITCVSDHTSATGTPLADECPSAIAALEALVTRLGPIARIRIEPGLFDCGNLWPGVGTPPACFGAAIFPGLAMHGWASFLGTGKVAAIALQRSSLQRSRVGPPFGPWQARIVTLVVPPAGWVMP